MTPMQLGNVMKMMGMEAPEEQLKAMIGEIKDTSAEVMNFDEFLALMVILVDSCVHS